MQKVKGTPSNFKNDESHLLHLGEVDWRVFRSTLLEHLPHSWQRREDTRFTLAHFDRRKRKKTMEGQLQQAIPTAHIPSLTDWTQTHTAQEHVMQPNTLVVHLEHGIEVGTHNPSLNHAHEAHERLCEESSLGCC